MKLTLEQIEAKIVHEEYLSPRGTLTICLLELQNGTLVTGESACVDPQEYNKEVGEAIARRRAIDKVWEKEGYLLKQQFHFESLMEEDFKAK